MILNIGICDDDKEIVHTIKKLLNDFEFKHDIDFHISAFYSAEDLLENYVSADFFHILFLDVEMSGMNGIELANKIRSEYSNDVYIFFISAYPEYMKDSFNVRAFQYLVKPIDAAVFDREVERIIHDILQLSSSKIIIKTEEETELVFLHDIIYMKALDSKKEHLQIITKNNIIDCSGTIAKYEKELAEAGFVSPSRGYLIQLSHLHFIQKAELIMDNNDRIPMSRRKEKVIRDYFNEKLLFLAKRR